MVENLRKCIECNLDKPLAEFYIYGDSGNPYGKCKTCVNQRNYSWAQRNITRRKEISRKSAMKQRWLTILNRYGITKEEYESLLDEQGHVCALCKNPETKINGYGNEVNYLAVDHDHDTKLIRALLCHRCNSILGFAKDNSKLLQDAAWYVLRAQERYYRDGERSKI